MKSGAEIKMPCLIAGPCAIENEEMVFKTAETLKTLTERYGVFFIFKASFDKANRMSLSSERGLGLEKGLKILADVKKQFDLKILTDIHESYQADPVASVCDYIQIPAFLARQTDLIVSASKTGRYVNIKKGQFISPSDMQYIAKKAHDSGASGVSLTERGSAFGYQDVILDPRSIVIMKKLGFPVILDVTHTTQKPGALGGSTGGDRSYTPWFIRVGLALSVDGFYMEVHPDPEKAISDKQSQIPLSEVDCLIRMIASDPFSENQH
jgi:2-dehydro-3-deoxyphosphooctonate aldolase (KDO 8-P synthase)